MYMYLSHRQLATSQLLHTPCSGTTELPMATTGVTTEQMDYNAITHVVFDRPHVLYKEVEQTNAF